MAMGGVGEDNNMARLSPEDRSNEISSPPPKKKEWACAHAWEILQPLKPTNPKEFYPNY